MLEVQGAASAHSYTHLTTSTLMTSLSCPDVL